MGIFRRNVVVIPTVFFLDFRVIYHQKSVKSTFSISQLIYGSAFSNFSFTYQTWTLAIVFSSLSILLPYVKPLNWPFHRRLLYSPHLCDLHFNSECYAKVTASLQADFDCICVEQQIKYTPHMNWLSTNEVF